MSTMVLVLNKAFMAIDTAPWERAISLLFQGAAQAVDENMQCFDFNDWAELSQMMKDHPLGFVNSPNLKIAIPEVIRLTNYDKIPKNDVVFTRRNILEAFSYTCAYCGKKLPATELNFDHVHPKCKGGKTNWENIAVSCYSCNSKKADKTLEEAGMKLRIVPKKPKHQPALKRIAMRLPSRTKASWQKFIDRAYWNSELATD